MAQSSHNITDFGISLFGEINNPASDVQFTQFPFTFGARGTSATLRVKNQFDAGVLPVARYRVDGGAWIDIPSTNYPGGTAGIVLFTGLSDTLHRVDVQIRNSAYNPLFIDGSVPCITVTGANPGLDYPPGFGDTLLPLDMPVSNNDKRIQGGGLKKGSADGLPSFVSIGDLTATFSLFYRHSSNGGTVCVFNTVADTPLEVWKMRGVNDFELVASVIIPASSDYQYVTFATTEQDCVFKLVYFPAGAFRVIGISVDGATKTAPVLSLSATGGILPIAIGMGTSLTVTDGRPDGAHTGPGNYLERVAMALMMILVNAGVGGSALKAQADGGSDISGRPGLSRESIFTGLTNVQYGFLCHGHNETLGGGEVFYNDYVGQATRLVSAFSGIRLMYMGLEFPSATATNVPFRAEFLGSLGAPGAIRRVVNTGNASISAGNFFYIDTDLILPGLLPYDNTKTYDNLHPKDAATIIEAAGVVQQAIPFVYPELADMTAPTLLSATINTTGTLLTLVFSESGSPPVLPATGATGVTVSGGHTVQSGTRTNATTITFPVVGTVYSTESLTLSYSGGNITDSAFPPNTLATIVNRAVTNNSTQVAPVLVVATPTFDPPAGTSETAVDVTVSCATAGASLFYTTNGSAPTTASTPVTSPIHIASTKTLKVLATKVGYTNSAIAAATYTITTPAPTGGVILQQIFLLPEYPQSATLEPLRLTAGNTAGGLSTWIQIEGVGVVLTGQEVALFSMRERGADTSIIDDQEAVLGPLEANGKRRVTFVFSGDAPVPDAGEYEAIWTVAGISYPFGRRQLVSVKERI